MANDHQAEAGDTATNPGVQAAAGTYARALLGAAESAGLADAVVEGLAAWTTEVLDRTPKLDAVLSSAMVDAEEKHRLLDKAFGTAFGTGAAASPAAGVLLKTLKVMATHGRQGLTRAARDAARLQRDKPRGRIQVNVVTAAALSDRQAANLRDRLRSLLGGEPVLRATVDPEVIGGLVVRVGDQVFDGSIATNLARLREQLINRSVHEIQRRRDSVSSPAGN